MKTRNPFAFADLIAKAMDTFPCLNYFRKSSAKRVPILPPTEDDHANCERKRHYPSRQHAQQVVDRSNMQQGHKAGEVHSLHTYPCPSCYHGGKGVHWLVGHTPSAQAQPKRTDKPAELTVSN